MWCVRWFGRLSGSRLWCGCWFRCLRRSRMRCCSWFRYLSGSRLRCGGWFGGLARSWFGGLARSRFGRGCWFRCLGRSRLRRLGWSRRQVDYDPELVSDYGRLDCGQNGEHARRRRRGLWTSSRSVTACVCQKKGQRPHSQSQKKTGYSLRNVWVLQGFSPHDQNLEENITPVRQ